MVEHLLLRPLQYAPPGSVSLFQPSLLPLEFTENDILEDVPLYPYHHHLSFFFPGEFAPFNFKDFKAYTERILEEEVPAHLVFTVYWLTEEEYTSLDATLQPWLEQMANPVPLPHRSAAAQDALHLTHTALVSELQTLHTRYHG
ncbi:MAG TPA: hypothetical protein DCR93_04085 [Cytophagales bacterium]|nr:hypothetical protein [Cytophagales bacterium]